MKENRGDERGRSRRTWEEGERKRKGEKEKDKDKEMF